MGFVFSSESVSEGHPDKVADQVSDAILDALLRRDPYSRVACETFVTAHRTMIGGEVTSLAFDEVDFEQVARRTMSRIGYDRNDEGMWDGAHLELLVDIVEQSPDIARGTAARSDAQIGAGDQGMMFGYAEAPTHLSNDAQAPRDGMFSMMPVPISLAHRLTRRLAEVRRDGTLPYLRPDAKSQVSVRFDDDGRPEGVDAIVLAAQHDSDVASEDLQEDLKEHVVRHVVPEEWLSEDTRYFINHTGRFVRGGPAADTGLTGRKIIVDTYGGWIPHGGGAFSGKDCTKVDRSAAYYARYVTKNLVAAGVAERLQVQVAYSIGSLEPVSYHVETFGTGKVPDAAIERLLRTQFSFAPGDLIEELGLRRPLYEATAAYGHFGRTDVDLPWEQLDRVEELAQAATV